MTRLSTFGGLVLASWCTTSFAQAFFPLGRINDTSTDTQVTVLLDTRASDDSGMGWIVWGELISDIWNDTNYTVVVEGSACSVASNIAVSDATSEAEVIPTANNSIPVAQCLATVGGAWAMNSTSSGGAGIRNEQQAISQGTVEVLQNPSYPTVLNGTANVMFDINFITVPWEYGTVTAFVDESWIYLEYSGGYYFAYGELQGYGSFYDDGVADGPLIYTAEFATDVGSEIEMGSQVSGNTQGWREVYGGQSENESGGVAITTSLYIIQ